MNPEVRAKADCCEEASAASASFYIPCNKPATKLVHADGRDLRMCDACAHHSVKNRGMKLVGEFFPPNPRAVEGSNAPPPYDPDKLADLSGSVDEWMRVSTDIRAKHNPIKSEDEAKLLTDHIGGLRGLSNKIDAARVDAKKPHDEAAKAVQAAFTPLMDRIKRATEVMLALQGDWLARKAEEERKRKAEEQQRADEVRAEADRLAKEAAASGNLDAEVEAERMAQQAADLEKQAARKAKVNAGSATGAGRTVALVEVREAELVSISQLFLHFRDHPKVTELLLSLANAELRSKDWDGKDIPGTRTKIEKRAR